MYEEDVLIYRNAPHSLDHTWLLENNPQAGSIARDFLSGELDLLRFTAPSGPAARDLRDFLEATSGAPLVVHRSPTGEILVTARPWSESLLLTGRTADVLSAYIHNRVVRMEDRFDMTVRQTVRAM